MEKFKTVVNSNSRNIAQEVVDLIDGQWNSLGMINKRADILDAQARALIGSDHVNSLKATYNSDTLGDIYSLKLPSYMAWDYWIAINQWKTYWVNRNEIQCEDDKIKAMFKNALGICVLYGNVAVTKKDNEYLIGCPINPSMSGGEIVGGKMLPSYYANKYGYLSMNPNDKTIELKDEQDNNRLVDIDESNTVFCVRRENGVGDFVWCMKDILIDIYIKTIIQSNASNLNDKMFMEVRNTKTAPVELWLARNPFIPYGVKVVDNQSGIGSNEFKFSEHTGSEKGHLSSLIEVLKHHQEYYYAKYGRPISSNKAQSLSSDSSLSISSSEAIATEWDDRVEMFANEWNNKFGCSIKIVKPELNLPPQNENADKEGLGYANTEGYDNSQQAKGE